MQSTIRGAIKCFAERWPIMPVLLFITNTALADGITNSAFRATTFGDWLIDCASIEAVTDSNQGLECNMSQQVEFEDNREPLLKIDLYLNPANSKPEAVFILPLGIPLSNAPVLSFNHSKNFPLQVSHCYSDGCYFKVPLNKLLLETFLSMQSGQVRLNGEDNETIRIPISGRGSRAAFNYFDALPKD